MKTRKKILVFLAAAVLSIAAVSCGVMPGETGHVTLVAANNGWDSQMFHIAIARLVIENAFYGYRLTTSNASAIMNMEAMINGDVDFEIESWAENYPNFHQDVQAGNIIPLGVLIEDSRQGLYVPRFVIEGNPWRGIPATAPTLARVEDLIRYPHLFPDDEAPSRGRVIGAIPGWHADAVLYRQFLHHGLDAHFNYVRLGNEAAIFASLEAAYNLGVGWVGYIYEPSWIAGRLDLVMLENAPFEPEGFAQGETAFPEQPLMIVSSRYFPARAPEVAGFLRRFTTGRELVSGALAFLEETRATHEQTAIWFLLTNDALIDDWLPSENAEKLREFLSQL